MRFFVPDTGAQNDHSIKRTIPDRLDSLSYLFSTKPAMVPIRSYLVRIS
jgi:hypothetical protein